MSSQRDQRGGASIRAQRPCLECHRAAPGQESVDHKGFSIAVRMTSKNCAGCHVTEYDQFARSRHAGPAWAAVVGREGFSAEQLEIFNESKHGALFNAQRSSLNLKADPKRLTTADMPVPTCSTCHMSGLEGMKMTHDVGERLSWYLFAAVSEKRPHYQQAQDEMQELCKKCHARSSVEQFYADAEVVLHNTNRKVEKAANLIADLRQEKLLTPEAFDEAIEFIEFDLWHYYGRTAKHGAFMGGADFVQWHGNYELLHYQVKLEKEAAALRAKHKGEKKPPSQPEKP